MTLLTCCEKFHPNDEYSNYIANDESSDMNRWENDGGRTVDLHGAS